MIGGAISSLVQELGDTPPERRTVDALIRADIAFLAAELVLLGLVVVNLTTSSASQAAAAALIVSGPYAWTFWGVVVALGILAPLALQALELRRRISHTVVPALLVLVGGLALRWIVVNAGQASQIVQAGL
jgi:formate-dependent nitrite reductase membrane component NrfD